jgi:hypothetical protein
MNDDNTRLIPLSQGKFALVDAEDYERLIKYNWQACYKRATGLWSVKRVRRGESGPLIRMAREIMGSPIGMEVIHKNYDGLDCRKANLQIVSSSEKAQHQSKAKNKTSRYKGVSWNKQRQKWSGRITKDGNRYHLGYFDNEEDAAQSYDEKALELYGATASLNFADNGGTPACINYKRPCSTKRKSDPKESHRNRRPCKTGSSPFKGVYWETRSHKWKAGIKLEGKQYHFGYFDEEADAARAYDEAAIKMFGEGAYLNFPQERLKHAQ